MISLRFYLLILVLMTWAYFRVKVLRKSWHWKLKLFIKTKQETRVD